MDPITKLVKTISAPYQNPNIKPATMHSGGQRGMLKTTKRAMTAVRIKASSVVGFCGIKLKHQMRTSFGP